MYKLSLGVLILTAAGLTGCVATPGSPERTSDSPGWTTPPKNDLVVEVAQFDLDSPAGLAVSSTGRVFVTFPWLEGQPSVAVGELSPEGEAVPFPNGSWNRWDGRPGPSALRAIVSAQALTITDSDQGEFLWVLDSGNPYEGGVVLAGPKLFKIDLSDDSIAQIFYFDHKRDFAADSLLSDLRIDPATDTAYVSDARRGGLYVIDLKQRHTRAVLFGHASTTPAENVRLSGALATDKASSYRARLGVAGIELSADRQHLYYHALEGRTLYRIETATLRDKTVGASDLAAAVETLGSTGSAMDGLSLNRDTGELYMAALEHQAVFVRRADGQIGTLVADERLRWPDSLALAGDGYLYFTASARHLKRPWPERAAESGPGYVLKASLNYLAQAALAAAEAAEARAAWQESKALADAAAARVEATRLAAEAEAASVASALREVAAASELFTVRQFETAQARQAAAQQLVARETALETAEQKAASAAAQAEMSSSAADAAAEAARLAELRAQEADAAAALALSMTREADQSAAEASAAEEAYVLASAQAEGAQQAARDARLAADRLQAAAEAVQARAQVAADAWRAEQNYAQEFVQAQERARRLVEIAERQHQAAQLAEVQRDDVDTDTDVTRLEIADVPTN
ncbi:MAG: L-dopachrome tautomerase-related protein [Planctomycetota bacterium]